LVSRLVTRLAANAPRALKAIRAVRKRAWALADPDAPGTDGLLTTNLDVTLAIAQFPPARGRSVRAAAAHRPPRSLTEN
jgi:hypothetical protein